VRELPHEEEKDSLLRRFDGHGLCRHDTTGSQLDSRFPVEFAELPGQYRGQYSSSELAGKNVMSLLIAFIDLI
jgi:hypothetical protein